MEIKDYLYSLSKNELLSLLFQLSDEIIDVKKYLMNKSSITESLKRNNAEKSEFQLSSDNQNHVSRTSSPQEKINLFKSLFAGRQDVFALRWQNSKSGKSGYSPVCANKWLSGKCDMKKYSCSTCPFKLPVRLNDKYFYNHLAGKDELARDVIGLYPLLPENLCRFLVIDFDAHVPKAQTSITSTHANDQRSYGHVPKSSAAENWKSDILAVHKTSSGLNIPSYMEISRSGNGGHLWFFFEDNLSAPLARNFGSAILKLAMQKRHSISFESFDRMFPNQDEIPKGGYGNLIALPLQGKAVKEGHSVFVDDDFKPFDDQWRFLSSINKVDEKSIRNAIRKINNLVSDFVEKDESELESSGRINTKVDFNKFDHKNTFLTQNDFPVKVKITLSNYIEIEKTGITERALGILRRTAVFLNPEYFKNLRMHLPLYNIPRFIDCSKENEKYLLLPRGNLQTVVDKLAEAEAQYEISDSRETGAAIEIENTVSLYDEQKIALAEMLKSDTGILCAGTGFGKTVVASALIAERKINTLILVQSHALLEQWKKSIKQLLNFTPGTIAAGKDKSTGIIDIAIVNSLVEKQSDEVKPRSYKYGMLIVDECHHVSAFTTENLVASFKSKYVYGLTATPIRRDGHQKIIFYQCGKVLYSTTTKQMNATQSFSHYFIPRFTSFHYLAEKTDNKNPSINQYYEKIIENSARNELIISDVKSAIENQRTPLILSERLEHLELLHEQLKDCAQNVVLITGKGTQKQKREQLENLNNISTEESLIILATGKYAGEGFDYPRIDTLMLAMPFSWKGTLSQYCGRLHRNFAGKEEVIIYDYVDFRIPVFDRMYQNRLKRYKHLGYTIKPKEKDFDKSSSTATTSRLYSKEEYLHDFEKDIDNAESKIIITAPYLSKAETQTFALLTAKKIAEGVTIIVYVKKASDETKNNKLQTCIQLLENIGIRVEEKDDLSQKIAIIDEKVLWYGNINYLGYTEIEECCMRIMDVQIASEIEGEVVS
ncbi:MAG: DEAD/DEAH box helicase family protein [Treponema sp.]|nr:DEAD/DEAH box helicase family protein [Treponema sp.]